MLLAEISSNYRLSSTEVFGIGWGTVSYTHLDVYKRQSRSISLAVRSRDTASAATRAFAEVTREWVAARYAS